MILTIYSHQNPAFFFPTEATRTLGFNWPQLSLSFLHMARPRAGGVEMMAPASVTDKNIPALNTESPAPDSEEKIW